METFEHQEMRERRRISKRGILLAGLAAGAITFVMSGGSPWTTAGTMNGIMGRGTEMPMLARLLLHLLLAMVYTGVIAAVVYRFKVFPAIVAGAATGLALYLANTALFYVFGGQAMNPEGQVAFCHFTFGMLAAAAYKGAAVPRPLPEPPGAPRQRDAGPREVAAVRR